MKNTMMKYKEIILRVDNPICSKCLSELRKKSQIDDYTYSKEKFLVNFTLFIDHKVICCNVEVLCILMVLTTWIPEVYAIFREKSFLSVK